MPVPEAERLGSTIKRRFWGSTEVMGFRSWKPGTSRWLYLLTGFYAVVLAVGLPVTIAAGQVLGWVLFSFLMFSGVCNIVVAYLHRRHARR
jgi:hypothetical protein